MAHILVVGGGFGGLRVVHELRQSKCPVEITLIDRKTYFEVTYATLRTLANPGFAGGMQRRPYSEFLQASFIQGEVSALTEQSATLTDGREIPFDYVVIATGTSYPSLPAAKSELSLTIKIRVKEIQDHHQALENFENVQVVGAGAVGTELAAEIKAHFPEKQVRLFDMGDRVLSHLKPKASAKAQFMLAALGVELQLKSKAERSTMDSFSEPDQNHTYWCGGPIAQTGFLNSHAARGDNGLLSVDPFLRVAGMNYWFAVGDIAKLSEAKMGATASNQGKSVAGNLKRLLNKKTQLKPYKSQPFMSIVPIGQKTGVAQIGGFVSTLKPFINLKQKDLLINYAMSQAGAT